jgi:hypothetical protein
MGLGRILERVRDGADRGLMKNKVDALADGPAFGAISRVASDEGKVLEGTCADSRFDRAQAIARTGREVIEPDDVLSES